MEAITYIEDTYILIECINIICEFINGYLMQTKLTSAIAYAARTCCFYILLCVKLDTKK